MSYKILSTATRFFNLLYRGTFALLLFILITADLYAQQDQGNQNLKKIELIDADNMIYDNFHGDYTRLIGNVIFKHNDIFLYCDSAFMYDNTNSVDALGRVHIKASDSMNIYGDSMRYNGNTRIAEIHDNVRMLDNEITLTTDHLTYNMKDKSGHFYDGGKIVDPENTLTSKSGLYFSEKKDFFFTDSVVLVNKDYTMYSDSLLYNTQLEIAWFYGPTEIISEENYIYCEKGWYDTKNDISEFTQNAYMKNDKQTMAGDSIFYDRTKGLGLAYFNVTITDTSRNSIIKANFVRYNEKEEITLATDSAMLIQTEEGDSLFLHADTLQATFDTSTQKAKILFAYHKAKFYRNEIQGMCDSLVYRYSDSTINMYKSPVLWNENKQLTADTIVIQVANNRISRLYLNNSSFMAAVDDSIEGRYNQVKGVDMIGYFVEGELKRIKVFSMAETIYYLREEDGRRIGANQAISTDMDIFIEDNEINAIMFLDKPEATLYPEGKLIGTDALLRGFLWQGVARPANKMAIFIW